MRVAIILILITCSLALGDDKTSRPSLLEEPYFPKPAYFQKRFFAPPPRIELAPPLHLQDFVADGKLVLSLKNYLELVAANNTDITIQKVNIEFARDQITRSLSLFDPQALAQFGATRTKSPSGSVLAGATTLNQLSQPFSLGVQQIVPTGGQYSVNFNESKSSTNSSFATFNPQLTSSLGLSFTQPLIRGRGRYITKLPIVIARSKFQVARYSLRDQVRQLVASAENAYWDVVGARENLRVQEESLKLADAALQRAKKELELGATSPLEIFQPEANFANAQVSVTQAKYRLAETEDALRKQMGVDLDPDVRKLPIELTESATPPDASTVIDREEEVAKALKMRPDLMAVAENLVADDFGIQLTRNRLLPDLSLSLQYGSAGLGGIFFPGVGNNNLPLPPIPGGLGDALSQVFQFTYPTYAFALTLHLPIKDRNSAANLQDAVVQKRLDLLQKRTVAQGIRQQVLTAVNEVENSRESVKLAKIARDLAQKRVEADQKRYELGTTTLFFVLASQGDFTTAESNLVTQSINYHRNLLTLLERTGELLDQRGIIVE